MVTLSSGVIYKCSVLSLFFICVLASVLCFAGCGCSAVRVPVLFLFCFLAVVFAAFGCGVWMLLVFKEKQN